MPHKTGSGNADAVPTVKLYVASTGWPYKPRWSPEKPLIVLTGGAEDEPSYLSGNGHICNRFKDLLCALAIPEHDDIFVVDISQIASKSEWREELGKPGRHTKTLSKWFMKLNPSASLIVAHGVDVELVEAMVRSWSTPCTSPVEWPVEKIVVVGKSINKKSLESVAALAKVDVVNPSIQAIKANISRDRNPILQSSCGVKFSDMHFVSVEFSLDPFGKCLIQKPVDIRTMVLSNGTAPLTLPTREDVERDLQTSEKIATHHLDFGVPVSNLIVQVTSVKDADAMTNLMVADAHGSIEALATKTLKDDWQLGNIVAVSGRVVSIQGRRTLLIDHIRPEDRLPHGYASVHVGKRSASQRTHLSGCLVIRGSKCLLVHKDKGVHIPFTVPRVMESKEQASTRAAREACKIYVEEYALIHDVPPAVAYDKEGEHSVVYTAYLAVATGPAPTGGCGCEEPEDRESLLYDWYDFGDAISLLKSAAEKKCLLNLSWALAEAANAGVVDLDCPFAFGPKLEAIDNDWKVDLGFSPLFALSGVEQPPAPGAPREARSQACVPCVPDEGKTKRRPKPSCCGPGGCSKKGCC